MKNQQKLMVVAVVMIVVFTAGYISNNLITKPKSQKSPKIIVDINSKKNLFFKVPELDLIFDRPNFYFYYPSELGVSIGGVTPFISKKMDETISLSNIFEYHTDVRNQDIDFETWSARYQYEIVFSEKCFDHPVEIDKFFDKNPDIKLVEMKRPVGNSYLYEGPNENGQPIKIVTFVKDFSDSKKYCFYTFSLLGGVTAEKIFDSVVDYFVFKKIVDNKDMLKKLVLEETQKFEEMITVEQDLVFKFFISPSGKYLVRLVHSWNTKVKYDNLIVALDPKVRRTFDHVPFCVVDFDSVAFTKDESAISFIGTVGKSQLICDQKKRIFLDLETGEMREK